MKIRLEEGILHVDCGWLRPSYEIPIDLVDDWELVAEASGTTYFCFNFADSTQHVSIPFMESADFLKTIESIEQALGQPPKLSVNEGRLTNEHLLIAGGVSLELLSLLLVSASLK